MGQATKATLLAQLEATATRIKQYILQQIADLSDAVMAAIPETYAGSPEAAGNATKANGILYGTVDSTSTSTAFTATIEGLTELYDGVTVMLKNGVVTSASGFTLDVNGLGAKPVYSNLAAATRDTNIFNVAYTMLFVYDSTRVSGGAWICYRGYDANTNTIGYQLRTNNTVRNVSDTARYYKLYFTSADGSLWVPASVNSTNNATAERPVNQRPIDPFGPIVYTSANTNYAAGANLTAATIWEQYALVLGYSFNRTGAALSLSAEKPVYVKCAPQADGSAIMDADEPIVQALPTTADGEIYIYLGIAYDATHIELQIWHPVYYHDGTGIRLWTGAKPLPGDIPIAKGTDTSGYAVIMGRLDDQTASGAYSVAAGRGNTVTATGSAAFGRNNDVSNSYSFSAGYNVDISGQCSFGSGYNNTCSGNYSHVEGVNCQATQQASHAEGQQSYATGTAAHAEGYHTTASAIGSHAEGYYTVANHAAQHVGGKYNVPDPSEADSSSFATYVEIIGNGADDTNRSNARTLDWSGNEVLAGKLTMGAGPTANMDAATKQYVDQQVSGVAGLPAVTASDNDKFLRVVNGAWAAATVPSATGVSF